MHPMYDPYEQSYPPSLWAPPAVPTARSVGTTPNMAWSKPDIVQWLLDHGIVYDDSATKSELLALITDG